MRQPRYSVVHQIHEALSRALQRGDFGEQLPSELSLAESFDVSRGTMRRALELLQHEGRLFSKRGRRRVLRSSKNRRSTRKVIGWLTPFSFEEFAANTQFLVAELRNILHRQDLALEVFSRPSCYKSRSGAALKALLREPVAGWILHVSNSSMQAWFSRQNILAIVAGNVDDCEYLPSVSYNYHAVCRHAASVLHRSGCRSLLLVEPQSETPGDRQSEKAFLETASEGGVHVQVLRHGGDPARLALALARLYQTEKRPDGIFVSGPPQYSVSVLTALLNLGLRVPKDIKLLSRDEAPFLDFTLPPISRYRLDHVQFARALAGVLARTLEASSSTKPVQLIPELVGGASL